MSVAYKYEPYFLFLLLALVIVVRVNVESTLYCTPDSRYYLEVSRNIKSGVGFVGPKVFDFNTEKSQLIPLYDTTPFGHPEQYQQEFFAVWPLGYPLAIVGTSYLSTLEPLWASKLLNILLIALDIYLLTLLFPGTKHLPIYYFGSYTMLEIFSYTWSENLFLTFFILYILSLTKINNNTDGNPNVSIALLSLSLIGMTLARYSSVIFFVATCGLLLWYIKTKKINEAKSVFYGLTIASIGVGGYLLNNYLQCGYLTGMPRINTQDFTTYELIQKFFLGMYNQLHIIKQFRYSGTMDLLLYIFLSLTQLSLMIYVGAQVVQKDKKRPLDFQNQFLLFSGSLYLVFLIYMTFTSTIDPFDYRTLLPFSFPIFTVILVETEKRLSASNHEKTVLMIKVFFLFSLLMNLPKKFILDSLL